MKRIVQLLCMFFCAAAVFYGEANAKVNKCAFTIKNVVTTAEPLGPDFPDAIKMKVTATGYAKYTHKKADSDEEIVNIGEQVVTIGFSKDEHGNQTSPDGPDFFATAKKKAEDLLNVEAAKRLAELCRNNQCNNPH